MKQHVFFFMLLVFIPVLGMNMDESVDYIFESGFVMENGSNVVFMHNSYKDKEYLGVEDAYTFMAESAYVIMVIQAGWEGITDKSKEELIKSIDQVAVPYNDYPDLEILYVYLFEVLDEFDTEEYYEMDNESMYQALAEWVDNFADEEYYEDF